MNALLGLGERDFWGRYEERWCLGYTGSLNIINLYPSLYTIRICLAAMIRFLADFDLQHVLQLTKYFAPFSSRSHMLLNGNTLANLEIYRNQTNYAERGSLFW